MISISTITADVNGAVIFKEMPDSRIADLEARVSRNATLDGGAEVVHSGVSDGDRTFQIRTNTLTETQVNNLKTIFESGNMVVVSSEIGCFYAAISRLKTDKNIIEMTIIVKEKLSS